MDAPPHPPPPPPHQLEWSISVFVHLYCIACIYPPSPISLQAYRSGLYGARYAWLILGWYNKGLWTPPPPPHQLDWSISVFVYLYCIACIYPPSPISLQAYRSGLYGARYAWLIPGWYNKDWWKLRSEEESLACTETEMNDAVQGYIACDSVRISPDNIVTVSGQVIILFPSLTTTLSVHFVRLKFSWWDRTWLLP